uniref:Uncharacterized protein n=1 Tax=viral metagenome TaxID=1070528 RepID=A0A6M3M467_9ZZZZ
MAFTITASSEEHGTIYPIGAVSVAEGADKVFSVTAYAGYVISNVWVDGLPVGAVSTYTFEGVVAAHTISVTFNSVPFDPVQFRIDFPEFADITKYPTSMLNFWAGLGDTLLSISRWGDRRPYGMSLFVAHNIVLAAQNSATAVAGGDPGSSGGLVSGEGAGPLNYSIDTSSISEEGGGNYNESLYGRMFLRLARIVGTGGIHV